jgi:hypothetical protein
MRSSKTRLSPRAGPRPLWRNKARAAYQAVGVGGTMVSRRCLGQPNTEISCEDRAILASAGFVSFISLLSGVFRLSSDLGSRR